MTLTVVTSGPKSSESQVRTALASAGFEVQQTVEDHGLPPHPQGKTLKTPQAFVTVLADEDQLDAVAACAQTLGYKLRLHHETPPESPLHPDVELEKRLAAMQAQIDELKTAVA